MIELMLLNFDIIIYPFFFEIFVPRPTRFLYQFKEVARGSGRKRKERGWLDHFNWWQEAAAKLDRDSGIDSLDLLKLPSKSASLSRLRHINQRDSRDQLKTGSDC
jgi:hypothetical protein